MIDIFETFSNVQKLRKYKQEEDIAFAFKQLQLKGYLNCMFGMLS